MKLLSAIILFLSLNSVCRAESITLESGLTLTGEIVEVTDDRVVINRDNGDRASVKMSQLDSESAEYVKTLQKKPVEPVPEPSVSPEVPRLEGTAAEKAAVIDESVPAQPALPNEQESVDLLNEGMQLLSKGENLKALENFKRVLSAYPQSGVAYYYAAFALGSLGEIDQARLSYIQAVQNGYQGEDQGNDVVGSLLEQYKNREFDIEYPSSNGLKKIHVSGNPGGDEELVKDTVGYIERAGLILNVEDISAISVRFIRWVSPEIFYEKWTAQTASGQKDFWVTFNTKPPEGFPSKTQIVISPEDNEPSQERLATLGQFLPDEKGSMEIAMVVGEAKPSERAAAPQETQDPFAAELAEAKALMEKKDCGQALSILDRVIAKDPANVTAYTGRAWCHEENKDFASAIKDYYKALEIRPDAKELYKLIAIGYVALGNNAQANQVMYEYHKYYPDDAESWYALAVANKSEEDLQKAEALGQQDVLGVRKIIEKESAAMKEKETVKGLRKSGEWIEAWNNMIYLVPVFLAGLIAFFRALFNKKQTANPGVRVIEPALPQGQLKAPPQPSAARYLLLMSIAGTVFNAILILGFGWERVKTEGILVMVTDGWGIILGVYVVSFFIGIMLYGLGIRSVQMQTKRDFT